MINEEDEVVVVRGKHAKHAKKPGEAKVKSEKSTPAHSATASESPSIEDVLDALDDVDSTDDVDLKDDLDLVDDLGLDDDFGKETSVGLDDDFDIEDELASETVTRAMPSVKAEAPAAQPAPAPAPAPVKPGAGGIVIPRGVPQPAPTQALPKAAAATAAAPGAETPAWEPIDYSTLKKASTIRKTIGIVVGVIAALLVAGYAGVGLMFSSHFFPGSSINGVDISLKSKAEAAEVIEQMASDYNIEVSGEGLEFTVSSQDMGIQVDGEKIASAALAENDIWTWPTELNKTHDITELLVTEYNAAGLSDVIAAKVNAWNETAEDPVNASLTYNGDANTYDVVPEQLGTKFDVQKVLEVVDQGVADMKSSVQLTQDQLALPPVVSDDPNLLNAQAAANGYVNADLHLMLSEGIEVGEINADQISQWVRFGDDMSVTFDDEAMDSWLTEFGNGLDTIGTQRTYTRPDGKTVTVEGGTYGWEIDTPAMVEQIRQEIKNGTQGEVYIPWIAGAAYYNGPGAVDWSDYIDVDLSEQHAYYITGAGEVLWESDTVTGIPDGKHDTPTGIWTLFSMESPAVLKGEILASTGAPEYETQVQYWMPFTYSGCGLHDATWQPAFGGSLYSQGYGSHGCVNLSYDAAESLFNIAVVGIPVIVHW